MPYILSGLIGLSALIQGGFYPGNFLSIGIVLTVLAATRKRSNVFLPEVVLWGLSLVYLLSSLVNGFSLESLSQACLPTVCSLFLSVFCSLSGKERGILIKCLIIGSGVAAGFAILAFSGIVSFPGAVSARRLQFPFQYANAAGSWFAAIALTTGMYESKWARRMRLPCVAALFLTRSVGALALYIIMKGVLLYRCRASYTWQNEVAIHVLAGLFSFALWAVSGWVSIPILALLYAAGYYYDTLLSPKTVRWPFYWLYAAIGAAGILAFLFSNRFSGSLGTLLERIIQMLDGTSILIDNPLLGIGAGNWSGIYPYYQTAQYTSSVIHGGIVQIGVDAGIFAVLIAITFCICAFRRPGRKLEASLAALLIILQGIMDFTLQFFPVDALFLALLFSSREESDTVRINHRILRAEAAVAGMICVVMLYGQMQEKKLDRFARDGDFNSLIVSYESHRPLFGESPVARDLYVSALYGQGDLDKLLSVTGNEKIRTLNELVLRADSLYRTGNIDNACHLLLSELEQQRYRVALYEETAELFKEWDADAPYINAYNVLAAKANDSQTTLGRLKGDQVYIEKITK